ncbi:hypothetical protein GMST_39310 [Geomonas silvestris]|uniref:Glycosyl transferase family 1 n=1 Tax=Geomonas silvestris TaxID=2740184 RepID=A0A6V8MNI0_9BACT|nr:glycosyltransferase family 1 protein [Geomonas silvestris]GFO61606.1 hypothetical protein GMST_39310 [Geomonas silvestris]
MRIGISLVNFNPGRMGGVESYFRSLLEALQRVDAENEYLLLCDERSLGHFPLTAPNFRQQLIRSRQPLPYRWSVSLVRRLCGIDIRRYAIDALKLDLIHHPFNIMSPKQSGTPVLLTVHDVQHEYYPEFFGERGYRKRHDGTVASLKVAKGVIAISSFTKESLVERYQVEPDRVSVVLLGRDPRFVRVEDPEELAQVRAKYRLERPFIYFPAASWPHKNHAGLLRALRLLLDRGEFDGELVMSGIAEKAQGSIDALVAELGLEERVRVLGYLEHRELPVLYSLARMLAFPSLFEGFGLPVVEAMGCGCPVACSNTTSLPEVAGDAAVFFDPANPEAIAQAVGSLWSDAELRGRLRELGERRVASFDWDRVAREHLDVFARVAAGKLTGK